MTASDFRSELKKGLKGGYLFYGEEEYLKQFCLDSVRNSIIHDKSLDTFNHIIFNGLNYSPMALAEAIQTLPIFGDFKLIEIHEINFNEIKTSETDALCDALNGLKEYDYNILIIRVSEAEFNAGSVKMPSAIFKTLSEYLTPVLFDYETPAKLAKWIIQHFSAEKTSISPVLCTKLIAYAGRDMYNLSSEIIKLSAYAKVNGRTEITVDDIEKVTPKVKEIQAFDFSNAVLSGNKDYALSIMTEMKLRNEKPEIILSGISGVYRDLCLVKVLNESGMTQKEISIKLKMHEYKVGLYLKASRRMSVNDIETAIDYCYNADKKIKSTQLNSYVILDKLIISVMR